MTTFLTDHPQFARALSAAVARRERREARAALWRTRRAALTAGLRVVVAGYTLDRVLMLVAYGILLAAALLRCLF